MKFEVLHAYKKDYLFPSWAKARKGYYRHYLRRVETPLAIVESMEGGSKLDLEYDYQEDWDSKFGEDDSTFDNDDYCWRCVGVHCTCFDDPEPYEPSHEDTCDGCGQRYCECDLRDPRYFIYDQFDDCLP